jgi:3-methylcrotonyl-CoA carboxylase alpha subunit
MFQKLLIANRGEIACRIARTARRLGISTVAVYSEADAGALHVALADEAWPIGPVPARDSYLDMDRIIDVAKRVGAHAIHPGYGFLAENADFAERCGRGGIVFVGPSPTAMRLMGSKNSAKSLMERAGVPIVPGYHAENPDDASLAAAAERIGFPVLVKASAGGGGRGMRVIRDASAFGDGVMAARREALAAFGDDGLLIEKRLEHPRHIEIQIFADMHGGVIAFRERDCSIQRHYQKIIEESPAPGLGPALRRAMADAAVAAVRSVEYVGAGTVEFLVVGERFYFLEMNTRLQVEHPVTEMISGLDLVEWQLKVACGEPLPVTQEAQQTRGCAVEARICAEDPARDFLPSVGLIEHYRPPAEAEGLRVDTGVRRGDRITPYYDSLVAKLVVWGADRASAVHRLRHALDNFEMVGVATNLDLLRALTGHSAFLAGDYDTGFVESEMTELRTATPGPDSIALLAAGAAANLELLRQQDRSRAAEAADPFSPWADGDAWRIDGRGSHTFLFEYDGETLSVRVAPLTGGAFRMETSAGAAIVAAERDGDAMRLRVDGVEQGIAIVRVAGGVVIVLGGRNHFLREIDPLKPSCAAGVVEAQLRAPVPSRVARVLVKIGDKVGKGAPLVVLEAMKMEFTLIAPRDGVISGLRGAEGEMVNEGEQLAFLAEEAAA